MTEEPLAVVTMVMGTFAADVIRAALEDAGIPAVTRGEQHSSWLFAGSGGGFGLVQVLVEAARLDEARAVLATLEEAEGGDDAHEAEDDADAADEAGGIEPDDEPE